MELGAEYQARLESLAEILMASRREKLGERATQLALFEMGE